MKTFPLLAALLVAAISHISADDHTLHTFKKIRLDEHFWSEGASFGDFNRDGKMDIVSGPYWYEGPDFKKRHEIYPPTQTFTHKKADGTEETIPGFEGGLGEKNTYSDNFFAFVYDFNNDGWPDVLIIGFPGKEAAWYENPQGKEEHWKKHVIFDQVDNESPTFTDIDGDGKPEIVCSSGGYLGYAKADWSDPAKPWKFHPISPKGNWGRFTHGLGVGDVNGDGRMDFIEAGGWWEQPASLAGDPVWTKHAANFGGGAQFYAYDVNGDGLPDIVGSVAAHGYGLAWWEQVREHGEITFRKHLIMGEKPEENRYGVHFSQLHALELADMDGDGLKDIVVGKRFWAHGNHGDPEPNAAPVLYWFQLKRNADKSVDFIPHLIDDNSGVGTQVVVGDVNGDGLPDVIVGNKKGTFVHIQEKKSVSKDEWEKAQPKANPAYVEPVATLASVATQPAPATVSKLVTVTDEPKGVLPLGKDGKPLNFDFETGTLKDWTVSGDAFNSQPVKGEIDQKRKYGAGRWSNHQGDYWIGGYEKLEDAGTGTLTSAPFKVTHPFAAFLFNGGSHAGTRIELVRADTNEIFFKRSGNNNETMERVVVDLAAQKDKEIFIRLVDEVKGGWGHVNFDDFRFYEAKPEFPAAINPFTKTSVAQSALPQDQFKYAGVPPQKAAEIMTLPPGFHATLFAGEPDVVNPIAFCIDDRGRLWVVEGLTYPRRAGAPPKDDHKDGEDRSKPTETQLKDIFAGNDRILVFEDTKGTGHFDKRTVFLEHLNLVSGIEKGFGGIYVGAAPYLMFIPVADGDAPKPAGPPQILLDGFGYGDTHETLNTFTWGPDGWLFGCHGVFTQSNVGKPGAPDSERTRINAGVWRFHPVKKRFELFAEGTSNPWGIDFDEHGQCITEGCVIPHLWHMIQNAHYQRQGGQHFNPNVYDDIKTIADHVHWAGGGSPHAGNGRSASAGGGHAHAGLLVAPSEWGEKYRGAVLMNNIHGACINMDVLEPKGSGFVGHHAPNFIEFNDQWSQIVNLQSDQDGSVYMIDWYDKNQCHNNDPAAHDRTNGRIFKITYGNKKTTKVDLQNESPQQLALIQTYNNDWVVRHARRILQERALDPKETKSEESYLRLLPLGHKSVAVYVHGGKPVPVNERWSRSGDAEASTLRSMWALHSIASFADDDALNFLQSDFQYVRAWAIQLACEDGKPSDALLKKFAELARTDSSPVVRLYLASAAQRIAPAQSWDIVAALHTHAEDAGDHNLPLMDWYALEPLVPLTRNAERGTGNSSALRAPSPALEIALDSKLPRTLEFTARRIAGLGSADAMNALAAALQKLGDEPRQLAILTGISAAFKGQRTVAQPQGWSAVEEKLAHSGDAQIRALAQSLSLTFGSSRSLDATRKIVTDAKASADERRRALDSLLGVKDAALTPVLLDLLHDTSMRAAALRGLAAYSDEKIPASILAVYPTLSASEKRDALLTLASRTAFARPLLAAIADGKILVKEVAADIARNIRGLNDSEITKQLEKVWGSARETSADKLALQAKTKAMILAKGATADASRGRLVFSRTCMQCHTLFGEGGKIGPDLTGSNRADIDYILHNIIDPNAEIPNQYRTAMVEMKDGQMLTGIANQQDPKVVTVAMPNETLTVPRSEIKAITLSEFSMMPEGLLTAFTDQEIRDLITYLRSPAQVKMAEEKK